jgi:hypothetical protein
MAVPVEMQMDLDCQIAQQAWASIHRSSSSSSAWVLYLSLCH